MPNSEQCCRHSEVVRGLKASVPVMFGFIPFALVLGAQATQNGFSFIEVPLMTGLNFGGGSEFTAMSLWTSPPHVLLIVAMSALVNSRHILMGAAMAPYLRHLPRRKALPALFFMCDESWAMALLDAKERQSTQVSLSYFLGVSIGLYLTWITFTALGAVLGPVLGDLEKLGLDMAFTAVFLVLLRGMWKGATSSIPWFVSLIVAGGTHLVSSGAWYVAAGAVSGLLAAAVYGSEK